MTSQGELKPCAHCGGSARFESYIVEACVWCPDCGVRVCKKHAPKHDTGNANAIAAWNRRSEGAGE
jgi:DNA-directed RNA polymerase subunit RPC12/RpoP